jgi:hypothetical protein
MCGRCGVYVGAQMEQGAATMRSLICACSRAAGTGSGAADGLLA